MSDTPKTDAVRYFNEVGDEVVSPSFARQLERENAELVAALKHCLDAGLFPVDQISTAKTDATALLAKLGEK